MIAVRRATAADVPTQIGLMAAFTMEFGGLLAYLDDLDERLQLTAVLSRG